MILIQNLCKKFEDKVLFDNYNCTIQDGEFVVFCGESGCGKTTLLNMIGCLEKPDSGSIIIDKTDIWKTKNKKGLFALKYGFLFQNFALLEGKTVSQNLEIIQKKLRTEISVEEALTTVGLINKIDTKVYKLSGGEQQRLALARLILKKCDIILADEPTGSLDEENADAVMDILHFLNQKGKTIILVTHSRKIIENERRVIKL
ncbi:MAG: ATP-binding cassette domain-containing protein [Oscillospiraceae bacterium]|nr:ATP-binding cassette domain-containing protein [Oscillospiraceae bacterium]MDO5151281.1 ATP-binding cassette domain-containing protein [Oscillospiraceae bacterium]